MAGLFAVPALLLAFLDAVGNQSWWLASGALGLGAAGGLSLMLYLQHRRRERRLAKRL
jgi:hypothetical protein